MTLPESHEPFQASPRPHDPTPAAPSTNISAAGSTQFQSRRFADRRPEGPRRVRHGLKLQGRFDFKIAQDATAHAPVVGTIAQRWYDLASQRFDRATLVSGHEYGQSGQTVSLDIQRGLIRAAVQGTAPRPYQVEIGVPSFDEGQWQRLIEAMSEEAIYLAKLLSGEIPQGLDELLAAQQLNLLPVQASDLQFSCTCTTPQPCKHLATIVMMVTERLDDHPLLITTVLGMPVDQLLERLRRARTIQAKGAASAHGDPMIPETQVEPPPLEACIDDFWHASRELGTQERTSSAHAPHALLRRLGPSPLSGKFPMVGLLASVYDAIALAARQLSESSTRELQTPPDERD